MFSVAFSRPRRYLRKFYRGVMEAGFPVRICRAEIRSKSRALFLYGEIWKFFKLFICFFLFLLSYLKNWCDMLFFQHFPSLGWIFLPSPPPIVDPPLAKISSSKSIENELSLGKMIKFDKVKNFAPSWILTQDLLFCQY